MERNVKLLKTIGNYLTRSDVVNGAGIGAMLLTSVSYLRQGDPGMGVFFMAVTLFIIVRYSTRAEAQQVAKSTT